MDGALYKIEKSEMTNYGARKDPNYTPGMDSMDLGHKIAKKVHIKIFSMTGQKKI